MTAVAESDGLTRIMAALARMDVWEHRLIAAAMDQAGLTASAEPCSREEQLAHFADLHQAMRRRG